MTATLLTHPSFVKRADAPAPRKARACKLSTFDADLHFWPSVDRSAGPHSCHPWAGWIDPTNQYGRMMRVKGMPYAHRRAWEVAYGRKIPKGKIALHACGNPLCCNTEPGHVYLGTYKQNTADAVAAGTHGKRKLNAAKAREIYALANAPGRNYRQIAEDFGIVPNTVFRIAKGIRWSKATGHGKDRPARIATSASVHAGAAA